jgi:hypothetical protein
VPVILASWEAEIWKFTVVATHTLPPHRQKAYTRPFLHRKKAEKAEYGNVPVSPLTGGSLQSEDQVEVSLDKKQHPTSKTTRAKMAGGMAQAVEHQPHKCKALSSNYNAAQRVEGGWEESEGPNVMMHAFNPSSSEGGHGRLRV